MSPRYSQRTTFLYGVRPPSWICKISIFFVNENSYLHTKFDWNRIIHRWDMEIKRLSAILNLQNFDFFVRYPSSEWKFASAYQIWPKSNNYWRLRYGDKAPFKMAAVRYLEFAKIAVLVTWPICMWFFISKFRINRPIWRRYIAKKTFSIRRPSAILNLQNFDFFVIYSSSEVGMEIRIRVPNLIEIG